MKKLSHHHLPFVKVKCKYEKNKEISPIIPSHLSSNNFYSF